MSSSKASICFPGGRIEAGETAELAALREFHEELGVDLGKITACGQLPQQFVYASDNEVAPLVFVTERPRTDWDPAPVEVDEVLEVPLSALLSNSVIESTSQNRRIRLPCVESEPSSSNQFKHFRSGPGNPAMHFRFLAPAYVHRENRIWGATAMILNQLAQCLLPFQTRAEAGPMDAKMAATSVRT